MSREYDQAKIIEENEPEENHLRIAFSKFVTELAEVGVSQDIGVIERAFRALDTIEELQDRIETLEAENEQLQERIEALGDIGTQKTSKEAKIASIITFAENSRKEDQNAVKVLPSDICGVANVSRRYAYELIDDMINGDGQNGAVGPDGYSWAHNPDEISQYGSMEIDSKEVRKGVIIDFEGVHGESVSVNNFNTESRNSEAAD